jgi:ribosomal protein S27E
MKYPRPPSKPIADTIRSKNPVACPACGSEILTLFGQLNADAAAASQVLHLHCQDCDGVHARQITRNVFVENLSSALGEVVPLSGGRR